MTPLTHTTSLMLLLEDLWSDERCRIDWRFEDPGSWVLLLTWTQEYGNLHRADWCEYTWQFYGDSLEECLTEAVEWCRALLPFEACGACDGRGWYSRTTAEYEAGIQTECEDCTGSGLAHPELGEVKS